MVVEVRNGKEHPILSDCISSKVSRWRSEIAEMATGHPNLHPLDKRRDKILALKQGMMQNFLPSAQTDMNDTLPQTTIEEPALPADPEPRCYLVRTIPELVEQNLVGVGWVDFPFCELKDAEEAIAEIDDAYGIGRYGNQIRRFFAITEGDWIIAPLPYSIAIGRATGGMYFNQRYYDADRANMRRVIFSRDAEGRLITVPRDSFSEAFQRRLRVMGMVVNDLGEFVDEIRTALENIDRGEDYSWLHQLSAEKERQHALFRKNLLENIQSGRTNLRTGGSGLEKLVCELLRVDGYDARVLSKRHFGSFADADIQASRSDRWSNVRLLVQVKHHQGYSNAHGLNQLREIKQAHQGEYDDHQPVFLTSASVSDELRHQALKDGITVLDGSELADWIGQSIERLDRGIKEILGIYEVPAVLQ